MTTSHTGRTPRIGRALTSTAEELSQPAPQPTVVGEVSAESLKRKMEQFAPPPWEVEPALAQSLDARQFVDCPSDIELRWVNPRVLEQIGWRHWQAVPARGDSRFKLKVPTMRSVDNLVRKGGDRGDILAWMPKHWVASRAKQKTDRIRRQSQAAVDRQARIGEEMRRGSYDRVRLDSARHPTHTEAYGRDLKESG